MAEDVLEQGETLLAEWRPAFRVFLRKLAAVGVFTALVFFSVSLGYPGTIPLVVWLIGFPLAVVTFLFVFGDYQEWFSRRHDRWLLTNRRLVYLNETDADSGAAIPLDQIDRLRMWLWSLTVRLHNRRTVTMGYLPNAQEVRAAILEGRDHATGSDNDQV